MRIYIVEPLGQGGLIHYSYHMARAMARNGADVTLITSTDYELKNLEHNFTVRPILRLWHARERSKLKGIAHKAQRAVRGLRYVREWLRLVWLLRREKPDAVLFGEIRFEFERYFLQALRRSGLRLADIVHDVRSYNTSPETGTILNDSPADIARYNRIYHSFDALFVHDRTNYELFLKLYDVPAERVHQITISSNELILELEPTISAEALATRLGLPRDKPIILFFGTVSKYKGINDLIQAMPFVRAQHDAHLLVAGFPAKDIDPEQLRALAAELGVADAITWWLDYVPNEEIRTVMELGSVIVLPYRAISQSGIIHIAYACGRPVVATRVGGLVDIIEDGRSGVLAEPENPQSIANALLRVLESPEQAAEMGAYARELAQMRFSSTKVSQDVLDAIAAIPEPQST